jgi:hypothetical protein
MRNSSLTLLKQQIETAFADVSYPGDEHLVDYPEDWEHVELLEAFKGRPWKELTYEVLAYHSFNFLSAAGFHYYLPAYLFMALDDFRDKLPFIVDGLRRLKPDERDRQWCVDRFSGLNLSQRRAVRAFLEYVRDEPTYEWFDSHRAAEINQAIKDFWADEATLLPAAADA